MDGSKFKITLFFYRYFHQFLVTDQRRGMQQIPRHFFLKAFVFKIEPVAVTSQKPGVFFQAEAVFFSVSRTEQHFLVSSERRFFPLDADALQNPVVLCLHGMV